MTDPGGSASPLTPQAITALPSPAHWRCAFGCGATISDEFYQEMLTTARHPPVCVCRYSLTGFMHRPWSLWRCTRPA